MQDIDRRLNKRKTNASWPFGEKYRREKLGRFSNACAVTVRDSMLANGQMLCEFPIN